VGANVTTQALKQLLEQARFQGFLGAGQVTSAAFPSGHATASMSLALCAVLAFPARARPLVALLGAGFALGVTYSVLALAWHYPSDVAGGYLVATAWTMAAVAVLFAAEERWPVPVRARASVSMGEAVAPLAATAAAAGVAGLAAVLTRPGAALAFARAHTGLLVGTVGLAVLGTALASALAFTLRR
jgi:hypothetical protein